MQMRWQQASRQPVEIWLRGIIDDSDIEILWREAHHLLAQDCERIWIYLEQMPRLDQKTLSFLADFVNLCHQHQVAVCCVVHQESLYQALLQQQIPVQRHDPERKINKTQLY